MAVPIPTSSGLRTDATPVAAIEPLTPALEREWDDLARRTEASPFLRPAYLRVWRASFGHDAQPELVAARRGRRLVGAMAVTRRGSRIGPPGNFETPAAGIVAGDPEAAAVVARALLECGARRIELDHLPGEGMSRRALDRAAAATGHRVVRRVTMRSPVVDTEQGWDAYWASRSRNLRHNVTRCRRRALEAGAVAVDVREAFEDGALPALLEEGFAVEGSGWKTEQGTAIATSPRTHRYYTDLATWAADEGWLRLSFLRIDGRPIAFCLGIQAFGVHHALKMGYDGATSRLSPGQLLLRALIQRAFDERLVRFDFAGHDEAYKLAWATGTEEHLWMAAFPGSPAGRVAHRLELARIALAESALAPILRPAAGAARRTVRLAHAGAGLTKRRPPVENDNEPSAPRRRPRRPGAVGDAFQPGVESAECLSTE